MKSPRSQNKSHLRHQTEEMRHTNNKRYKNNGITDTVKIKELQQKHRREKARSILT